jgi:hypothetical protein
MDLTAVLVVVGIVVAGIGRELLAAQCRKLEGFAGPLLGLVLYTVGTVLTVLLTANWISGLVR